MHYLVCDLNIQKRGHYIGYNQYILDHIHHLEKENPSIKYSLLYNTEAKEYLSFPEYIKNRVYFLNDNCWSNESIKGKISLFKKVVAFGEANEIDHLIFMDLDQYQLPIFISKFPFNLSGILFRPHHRIVASNESFSALASSKMQRLKKIVAEKFLTSARKVKNIYILNDEDGVQQLNRFHHTSRFKYLSDPVFAYPSSNVSNGPKGDLPFRFLIFGAINERKNITAILKAYNAAQFNGDTELVIVGSSTEEYISYLNKLLKNLSAINSRKAVVIKAGFVTNEEMDHYFAESDVCLLIYKDFYGSSGLLGRAALHRKKVIGSNVGLLKELIEKNHLGITCDPNSIEEISKAMVKVKDLHFESRHFESFYQKYSPEIFIRTLLS